MFGIEFMSTENCVLQKQICICQFVYVVVTREILSRYENEGVVSVHAKETPEVSNRARAGAILRLLFKQMGIN